MNEKLILPSLFIGSVSLFSSCLVSRMVYRADPIQAPCLTQKGDKEVSAGVQSSAAVHALQSGWQAGAAYAFSKNVSVQGQFVQESGNQYGVNAFPLFFIGYQYVNDSSFLYNRNKTWSLAGAYLFPLQGRSIYLSSTLGAGSGHFLIRDNGRFNDTAYSGNFQSSSFRCYLQEALCFIGTAGKFEMGIRGSISAYTRVRTSYSQKQQMDFLVDSLKGNALSMMQPFLMFKVNLGSSRLQLECQASINVGGSNTGYTYNYLWLNAGVGLIYHFYPHQS